MRFYFIRHGESTANLLRVISNRCLPHPLTATGRQQAAELAERLTPAGPIRLFHSPIPRAVETAQILAAAWSPEQVIEAEALREYDLGIYEGQSSPEAWRVYQQLLEEWVEFGRLDAAAPGGESWLDMRERFQPWLFQRIGELENRPGSAVFISHGGLFRSMLPETALNLPRGYPLTHPLGYTGVIEARPFRGKLVITRYGPARFTVIGPKETGL